MDQEKVNKLVCWLKKNKRFPEDQLFKVALDNGVQEEDFIEATKTLANSSVFDYSSVWLRFLATFLDYIFLGLIFILHSNIYGSNHIGGCSSSFSLGTGGEVIYGVQVFHGLCGIGAVQFVFVVFLYFILLEWMYGGTFGKVVMGIRVVKLSGEPLDLKTSFIRNILRIVDFLPYIYLIGAISIWSSKSNQRIGDRIAKTVVVSIN